MTKIIQRIKNETVPLLIKDEERTEPHEFSEIKDRTPMKRRELVFMYSGQGSHYFQMGKELYMKNDVFRKNMKQCSTLLEQDLEKSLVNVIYDDSKRFEDFDDILYTNPALFSVGYSLTQVLYDRGIGPNIVLGNSLGEYIAAVVAGMFSLEEGLKIVVQQAKFLHEKCSKGGMLVVLDQVTSFKENPQLFQGCTLAGINYENCFIISGLVSRLKEINYQLNRNSVYSQLLPVNYAFHSELIDPIKKDFMELLEKVSFQSPQIPIYSSVKPGKIIEPYNEYPWDIIREKIQFKEVISLMQDQKDLLFVDLSPTGSLSNFIKHGFEERIPSLFTINKFGQNIKTLDNLVSDLEEHAKR